MERILAASHALECRVRPVPHAVDIHNGASHAGLFPQLLILARPPLHPRQLALQRVEAATSATSSASARAIAVNAWSRPKRPRPITPIFTGEKGLRGMSF